jgi:hypothetical protein
MHRNKQITDEEYKAAQDFHKYFVLGHRVGGLTARYGELTSAGGTPPGQQIDAYNARGEIRLTPDELRTMYNGLWSSGVKALLTANPLGTDHFIATWVQRIVCEDYSVLEDKVPTLAECGRAYSGWKSDKQATATGVSLIKQGLERLAAHYGIGKRKPAKTRIHQVPAFGMAEAQRGGPPGTPADRPGYVTRPNDSVLQQPNQTA